MKTSSISQRVADFLGDYPPFEFMESADLLELASRGRVKFHEGDEIVFSKDAMRTKFFYVVQQGTVNLLKQTEQGEEIVDVRVEGDMLGVYWMGRNSRYLLDAKTASDTILYALEWDLFVALAKKYPEVSRYLASYFYDRIGDEEDEEEPKILEDTCWLSVTGNQVSEEARKNWFTAQEGDVLQAVLQSLASDSYELCIVVGANMNPVGYITSHEVLQSVVASGSMDSLNVGDVMSRDIKTIAPGQSVDKMLLAMMRNHVSMLLVTQDGSPKSAFMGVLLERFLHLYHGRMPNTLMTELAQCDDPIKLKRLRGRTDELLLYYLSSGVRMDWVFDFIAEVENTLVSRFISISERELMASGLEKPNVPFAWLAIHSEGRKERLLKSSQRHGIVFQDSPEADFETCQQWFLALAESVVKLLETCGFSRNTKLEMANNPEWCQSLDNWKAKFSEWIANPIESRIIQLTPFFDMRRVVGDEELYTSIQEAMHESIEEHKSFMPLLANDAMENLPPVTIFRNSVMDKSGVLWTSIDTKQHALYPLVDIARVFALRYGLLSCTSTVERFEEMALVLPKEHSVFEEAAQAARITLSLQTATGLKRGDNGQYIRANELTKVDQENFKGVFRTIVRIMEFTAKHFELK